MSVCYYSSEENHSNGISWTQSDGQSKPGSLASRNGKILQGDRILEINGQDVRKKSQADVSKLLRDLEGEVVIVFGRVPNKAMSIQEWSRQKAAALNSDVSPDRTTAVRSRAFTWSYASPATSTPSMRSSSDKQNK
ncbi:unnamed protein product [Notodromas monacha]|uniref:PDZ domain-containing protein n=1 Tax=Notodromas monacha TaxID=399045 RepID=A0A7R9GI96_9CRUS|nr:unnamed protein product [Notodromas monacha]CAG0923726.1 unnamed protein product [Notodromas monacha]